MKCNILACTELLNIYKIPFCKCIVYMSSCHGLEALGLQCNQQGEKQDMFLGAKWHMNFKYLILNSRHSVVFSSMLKSYSISPSLTSHFAGSQQEISKTTDCVKQTGRQFQHATLSELLSVITHFPYV